MDRDDRLGRRVSLKEMVDLMGEYLAAPYALNTVRAALKRMGVPGEETHVEGGRGRFYKYDPLLCWVLATIYHRKDLRSTDLMEIAGARREFMSSLSGGARDEGAKLVTESRLSAAAYYSFITDVSYGIDLRQLRRIVEGQPDSLLLTISKNGALLREALRTYSDATVRLVGFGFDSGGKAAPDLDSVRRNQLRELGHYLEKYRVLEDQRQIDAFLRIHEVDPTPKDTDDKSDVT